MFKKSINSVFWYVLKIKFFFKYLNGVFVKIPLNNCVLSREEVANITLHVWYSLGIEKKWRGKANFHQIRWRNMTLMTGANFTKKEGKYSKVFCEYFVINNARNGVDENFVEECWKLNTFEKPSNLLWYGHATSCTGRPGSKARLARTSTEKARAFLKIWKISKKWKIHKFSPKTALAKYIYLASQKCQLSLVHLWSALSSSHCALSSEIVH